MKIFHIAASTLVLGLALQTAARGADFDGTLFGDGAVPGGQVLPGDTTASLQDHQARMARAATEGTTSPSTFAPTINFSINSDEKNAKLSGVFDIGGQNLTITAQTPFNQGQNYVNIVSLDGLTKASSLSFSYEFKPAGGANSFGLRSFALNGNIGYEQHDFYDPITLAGESTTKTPWQIGLKAGWLLWARTDSAGKILKDTAGNISSGVSFNISFDYQQSYEDGTTGQTQTKCINLGATCVTGFIGAPTLAEKGLATADLRWIDRALTIGTNTVPIGAELLVTYDPIQNEEAVQVPIFLAADKDRNLKGGIRYDWTSTSHISTVGVFVSAGFDILGG